MSDLLIHSTFTLYRVQSDGQTISWKHVTDLYHKDSGKQDTTPRLCLVPKLKYEHVHLTSFSKMQVDLAA